MKATTAAAIAAALAAFPCAPNALAAPAYPTDGWKLPMKAAQLRPADREALYRASGFVRRGASWKGCDGQSDAAISDDAVNGGAVRDLNGDGRPEVFVMDTGSFCYGATEAGFRLLTPTPRGWKVMWESPGYPTVLKTRGAGGWPDIIAGGPGFCQPVYRWNGRNYDLARMQEEEKRACARR